MCVHVQSASLNQVVEKCKAHPVAAAAVAGGIVTAGLAARHWELVKLEVPVIASRLYRVR